MQVAVTYESNEKEEIKIKTGESGKMEKEIDHGSIFI